MAKGDKKYRVVQNEGKISFRVEELWDGGQHRGPFGSKVSAIQAEEKHATESGFIDDLALEGVVATEKSAAEAFKKLDDSSWKCVEACSIEMDNKEVVFTEGQEFIEGNKFMGIDVAKWLKENA